MTEYSDLPGSVKSITTTSPGWDIDIGQSTSHARKNGPMAPGELVNFVVVCDVSSLQPGDTFVNKASVFGTSSAGSRLDKAALAFKIPPLPTITNFSPAAGAPGTEVVIGGNYLNPDPNNPCTVQFNGVPCLNTILTNSTIRAIVPPAATSGFISVTNPLGTANSPVPFTVYLPPTTFAQWQQQNFTLAELLDPNISGPNADPNHNGFPNLADYAMHIDPHGTTPPFRPYVVLDATTVSIVYQRLKSATDVTITVEKSADLQIWTPVLPTNIILSDDGVIQVIKAQTPRAPGDLEALLRLVPIF